MKNQRLFRVVGWLGSVQSNEVMSGTVGREKVRIDSESKASGSLGAEGFKIISEYLSAFASRNTRFQIVLRKELSQLELIFAGIPPDASASAPLRIEEIEADLAYLEMNNLEVGLVDYAKVSSNYPDTLIKSAATWPNGTGLILDVRIMDKKEIFKTSAIVQEAIDGANALATFSASESASESNAHVGHVGTRIVEAFKSHQKKTTSLSSQMQIQGGSVQIESLEEFLQETVLPTLSLGRTPVEVAAFYFGERDTVLRSLNFLTMPPGAAVETAWGSKKQLTIGFEKYDSAPNDSKDLIEKSKKKLKKFEEQLPKISSYMNIEVLSQLISLSPLQLPGISYGYMPTLNRTLVKPREAVGIGILYDRMNSMGEFSLEKNILAEHVAVLGQTGTGKTNTIKVMASSIAQNFSTNVLILESSKNEYGDLGFDSIVVGETDFHLPLFSTYYVIEEGGFAVSKNLEGHIGGLWNAFSAAFPLEGPMIPILRKALDRSYSIIGWEYSEEKKCHVNSFGPVFPSISDLCKQVEMECDRLGYAGELRDNIRAALINRIESLGVGPAQRIYLDRDSSYVTKVFERNVVICLDKMEAEDDKAFFMTLLFNTLRQYLQFKNRGNAHDSLSNIVVIEEAHRVIPNVDTTSKSGEGSTRNKERSVENFNNAIAELRAFGVGIVVADQSPSRISIDVLRNVGTKIIHSVQERDDQEAAASILGMAQNEANVLSALPDRGFALVRSRMAGIARPSLVKVSKYNSVEIKLIDSNESEFRDDSKSKIAAKSNSLNDQIKWLMYPDDERIGAAVRLSSYCESHRVHYGISGNTVREKLESMTKSKMHLNEEVCKDCPLHCRVPVILNLLDQKRFASVPTGDPVSFGRELANFIYQFDNAILESQNETGSFGKKVTRACSSFFSLGQNRELVPPDQVSPLTQGILKCALAHLPFSKSLTELASSMSVKKEQNSGMDATSQIRESIEVSADRIAQEISGLRRDILPPERLEIQKVEPEFFWIVDQRT